VLSNAHGADVRQRFCDESGVGVAARLVKNATPLWSRLRLRIESKPAVFNKNGIGIRMLKTSSIAVATGNQ
jgi:hypothetical protein